MRIGYYVQGDMDEAVVRGLVDRNIECWLAIDREALAEELDCSVEAIPDDDPSDFIKRGFGLSGPDSRQEAKARVGGFVARAPLKSWIERSDSFEEFYRDARRFALQAECTFPNELES